MKTVLVTGAAGFIGSHLCDALLARGDRVIGIDNFSDYYAPDIKEANIKQACANPDFQLNRCDIRDSDSVNKVFAEASPEVVVHLAAQAGVRPSLENPNLYHDINVMGSQNILDACRNADLSHLVFASSSSVYGTIREVPFRESMDVSQPISPYAATKRMNELMGHVYHHLYGMNITMLRFFTAYGPRQRPDMAIHKFTNLISSNQPIQMYGDGSTYRDYTYISDIIDGVIKAVDTPLGYEIINLGESQTVSLRHLIDTIGQCLECTPIIEQLPMQPGDVKETYADISKARQLLGYAPETAIEEGIQQFVHWFNANRPHSPA